MPTSHSLTFSSRVFFADAMLGRLARWLRMLGYDTAYEKVISDESFGRACFDRTALAPHQG
jgi:uncharacterized protein with PIN domain